MRSALYYPHTEVKSSGLLKNSLLLWDRLEYIVPYAEYKPVYPDVRFAEAVELIGRAHLPAVEEQRPTHEAIEEFAKNPLPDPFYYTQSDNTGFEDYEIYPQKLLPHTWCRLQNFQLAHRPPLGQFDYLLKRQAGLAIMALLADSCAGETLARVTDQGLAYATLNNLAVDNAAYEESAEFEMLVPMTLNLLNVDDIPLEKFIAFRKREDKDGTEALRHNYLKRVEDCVVEISKLTTKRDREERARTFESDMQTDLDELSREIWHTKVDFVLSALSKELVISVITAGAVAANALHVLPFEVPSVYSLIGALPFAGIGGLLARNKYAANRRATMQKHPMAYLYEFSRFQ